jgi:hypothetical protein
LLRAAARILARVEIGGRAGGEGRPPTRIRFPLQWYEVYVPGSATFRRSLSITIGVKTQEFWPVEVVLHEQPRALPIVGAGRFVVDLEELQSTVQPRPYGELLGRALFTDSVRDLFVRGGAGTGPLHLMLSFDAPELRPLQWERLCAPRGGGALEFVGLDQRVAYSRYIPSPVLRSYRELAAADLRALVLVAAPDGLQAYGLAAFDAEAAVAAVRAGLPGVPCTVLGPVAGAAGPATLDALCGALTDGRHTIVHVIAHGRTNPVERETLLYLAGAGGDVDVVEKHQLIARLGLLAEGLPHLMFFAACDSGVDLGEDNIGGLARGLVGDLGIPAVLAMSSRVSIATAEALTRSFYANLLAHGHVDQALVEANAELASRRDALVPALYSRLGALPLFTPDARGDGDPEPEYSRSDMRAWSAALQQALARRDQLAVAGRPTHTVDSEISGIRHRMRQDGQLHAGDVLRGRYLLLSLLGEGPSSAVWRAHDRTARVDVALKILHPQHTRRAEFVRQFRSTIDRLRTLEHPNIVRVLGPVEEEHGRVFAAIELLTGSNLRDAVRERRIAPDGVLAIVDYLAAALTYAHGRGIIHRDVEPTNVIFDADGVPHLIDFDMLIDDGKIVDTGISHLTPGIYIAPERLADQPRACPESDVYGLAVTALFMITGSPPFEAFREPRRFFARLPVEPHVRRALRRAIAFAPRDRFRTIAAFVAALKTPDRAPPWRWIVAVGALVVGALVIVLALAC